MNKNLCLNFAVQAEAVLDMIGFPEFILDATKLNERYEEVCVLAILIAVQYFRNFTSRDSESSYFLTCLSACLSLCGRQQTKKEFCRHIFHSNIFQHSHHLPPVYPVKCFFIVIIIIVIINTFVKRHRQSYRGADSQQNIYT